MRDLSRDQQLLYKYVKAVNNGWVIINIRSVRVTESDPAAPRHPAALSIPFYFEYISNDLPFQLSEGISLIKFSRLANETVKNCLEGTVFE